MTYELTKTSQGGSFVRYLPPGVPVGAQSPQLTVGTYPFAQPLAAIRRLGARKGRDTDQARRRRARGCRSSFPEKHLPRVPGLELRVEVFDPSLARARQLVTSGQIIAVS